MIHILFGNYLKRIGKLDSDQLAKVYEEQKKVRVKLGLIAVSEKLMTLEQADEVNKLQSMLDKRFGDIAVEKGYLTNEQVGRLLGMQGNLYLSFIQEITNENLMTMEEIEEAYENFQKELNFTQTEMDRLKSGEADLLIPLFLPLGLAEYQKEHILVFIKTLMRLIDNDLYIDKAGIISEIDADGYALQHITGDADATLCFAAEDADALDACAEFINCVNGMFASDCSPKFNVDMLPPQYKEGSATLTADRLCLIPVYIQGVKINLISVFNEKLIVEGEN